MTFSQSKYNDSNTSGLAGNKFLYLLAGAGIGAATALLFAPKAGVDLRSDIADITRKGYDETLDLAQQLKDQSADLYQSIKEKTDKVYELAAEKFSTGQQLMDTASNIAGDLINGETGRDKGEILKPSAGRRPSNII